MKIRFVRSGLVSDAVIPERVTRCISKLLPLADSTIALRFASVTSSSARFSRAWEFKPSLSTGIVSIGRMVPHRPRETCARLRPIASPWLVASAAARWVLVELSPPRGRCRLGQRTTVEPGYLLRCKRYGCQAPCSLLPHENRCLPGRCRTGLQRPGHKSSQRHILSPAQLSICTSTISPSVLRMHFKQRI